MAGPIALAALLALVLVSAIGPYGNSEAKSSVRVLVFSKTAGFRHDSISPGVQAIRDLGRAKGFSVDATENASALKPKRLRGYDAVVFLNTTGDILGQRQQAAFKRYIRHGGGFVGIHSATDTEHEWPFYGGLVGAYFQSHPQVQPATVEIVDRNHPSTRNLPARWLRTDEWYNLATNPRGTVHVLAVLDESSYLGGTMGSDHPIAWCHLYRGGRAWYTGGGHTVEAYAEPMFRKHLLGGIRWAAGRGAADCRA